ncbi:MAG: Dihydrofolate reductase [Parcubacteria bacterium C7867-006]|nr:MAG: Dihydrofolate reductase [Parcubacteria bacterium C7867-006]
MKITMIVAMARLGVIGKNGNLPWAGKLRADMDHFKKVTMNKTVVMGRKTFDSIPARFKPLPERENVILTRDSNYSQPDCLVLHHRDEVLRLAELRDEVFIIGGAEIYRLMMPYTSRLIVTHLFSLIEGDTFFPPMPGNWNAETLFNQEVDEKNFFPFSVVEYTRD